jgi:succinoglycan biosynthesis protein ExoA
MPEAEGLPFVTLAVPCLNEAHHIEACLDTIFHQEYPADRFEVLVADGGSTDGTREILARAAAREPRLKVIDNPRRVQAAGLNEILAVARGEVIVRMDVHCEYASSYVRACVDVLERTGADNVGGAQRARAQTRFQKALCAALTSPLGIGGARYRDEKAEGFVDTVFLGAFKRRVFETVGLYDPAAITNEDAELNQRLRAAGGRVYLSRDVVVHYYPRTSLPALAKQYFKYGRGRARTVLKTRQWPGFRPILPFLMTVGGAALTATTPFHPFTLPAFLTYGAATGIEAARVTPKGEATLFPIVWAIFPTLHVSHGVGFAVGLVRYGLNPDWPAVDPRLPPRTT